MRRTSRDNAICFESLEEALAKDTEAYRHLHLICFGFPCQDISQANSKAEGIKGKRSSVFFECWRMVELLMPKWVLIENVPRLLSINEGRDMACILQTMAKSGYGWSYRLLDSQFWGVAQRRKRVFIIGCLGRIPPPEILFERESCEGDDKTEHKMESLGQCVSNPITTRDGLKYDPTAETFIAESLSSNRKRKKEHIVASTIGATPRGDTSFVWQDTYIAETVSRRKRETTRISSAMDSRRGIVIGNAVTVNVAEWIGKRIKKYEEAN